MTFRLAVLGFLALLVLAAPLLAQPSPPIGPIDEGRFKTTYVRLGADSEGLLYQPSAAGNAARVALIFSHPSGNSFNAPVGREMARRGHPVLMVNYRGTGDSIDYLPGISRGIALLRRMPGATRVVIVGHSGGGHLMALYQNVAEHGAAACQGPEKIYPCRGDGLAGLEKADGVILLDPTLGAFHQMSAVDPAAGEKGRIAALDMFAKANGYDPAARRASYSPAFARRFYAAQAARNARIVREAQDRLAAISEGRGRFTDDEPLVIAGMGVNAAGARLYQPDPAFASHTRVSHLLLKADGTDAEQIVASVRPPSGQQAAGALHALNVMTQNTTVRHFLAESAIRTGPDFAITADDIVGVDWASAVTSTPDNARGISVPALVMTMSCHYLVVPGEVIFDSLAARDKSYVSVEGAAHIFTPCRPEYGDTVKRSFDFVEDWLAKDGRF